MSETRADIRNVKDELEKQLSALPGFQGIGISRLPGGEACIVVYLAPGSAAGVPESFEGFPVITRNMGGIKRL